MMCVLQEENKSCNQKTKSTEIKLPQKLPTTPSVVVDNEFSNHHPSIQKLLSVTEEILKNLKQNPSPNPTSSSSSLNTLPSYYTPNELKKIFEPILQQLSTINAQEMLATTQPIHDEIVPKKDNPTIVRYLHIAECEHNYSLGIFVFPPGARIPLHDHPGMCVMSRVLYGELQVRSYDILQESSSSDTASTRSRSWLLTNLLKFKDSFSSSSSILVGDENEYPLGSKIGKVRPLSILSASQISMLFPQQGNLHEFTAGPNGAAMLDLLVPPYDDRDCTFYCVEQDEDEDELRLIPIPQPIDFQCTSGRYREFGEV